MTKLVDKTIQTIPSYEVAKMIGKRHGDVLLMLDGQKDKNGNTKIVGIIPTLKQNGELQLADYFIESTYNDRGRQLRCYECTKLGCDMLANKMTGEKGILFTAKYVKRFDEMEQYIKEQQPKVPTTYKEALEHLLVQVEENERLALQNEEQQKTIQAQSDTITELVPKADYFDALVDRKLLTSIRDTAKELKVKEKDFTAWLIQRNLCYRDKKKKIKPYANKMKYFELKEFTTIWGHSDTQTLITPKGRETFRLLLIKDGLIKDNNEQMELEALLQENEVVKSDFYS